MRSLPRLPGLKRRAKPSLALRSETETCLGVHQFRHSTTGRSATERECAPLRFTPNSFCLDSGGGNLEEAIRILCDALIAHFEMHMRPSRASGGTGLGDYRAALHQTPRFYQQLRIVGIAGRKVVA